MNSINQTNSSNEDNSVLDYLQIKGKLFSIPEIESKIKELEEEVKSAKDKIRNKDEELIFLKVSLRENSIEQQYNRFIERRSDSVKNAVYLNKGLLRFVVKSYYDDIHRYKNYSGSKWANNHKQAAYTIKWIVKFKPIQIKQEFDNEETLNKEIIDVNLIFALVCGFSFLDKKSIDLISVENRKVQEYNRQNKDAEVKQSFYEKLLYIMRYRPFSGKQLISIFEVLDLQI